jgi:polysaccharide deacetylase family protein (PEP-CTERM system associated)
LSTSSATVAAVTRDNGTVNALSCDVEDYFQVAAFDGVVDRSGWDTRPGRVERNTHAVLDLFGRAGVKGTFFTLGWVADRHPGLVRRMVAEGHEVASHGYDHAKVTTLTPDQFRRDIRRTKALLEDLGGTVVKGYRAPSYSIGRTNLWALDVLQEEGHRYSSSIYPINHDHYGMPEAPRFALRAHNGMLELPITTTRLFSRNLPAGGGGFFRLLPYRASRWAIARVNRVDRQPAIFYFHPWEVDPGQPRVAGISVKSKFRHYLNLDRMESRLDRPLTDFQWGRMDRVFFENVAA